MLCACKSWADVEELFGREVMSLLSRSDVTYGTIILAGTRDGGASAKYVFTLRGYYSNGQDHFGIALWDANEGGAVNLGVPFQHELFTVWSTNTDDANGGYFFTGYSYCSAKCDDLDSTSWATPSERGINDLSLPSTQPFTRYRIYTDYNPLNLVAWGADVIGNLAVDFVAFIGLADTAAETYDNYANHNNPFLDNYPLVYTGNEWIGEGPYNYTALTRPRR